MHAVDPVHPGRCRLDCCALELASRASERNAEKDPVTSADDSLVVQRIRQSNAGTWLDFDLADGMTVETIRTTAGKHVTAVQIPGFLSGERICHLIRAGIENI